MVIHTLTLSHLLLSLQNECEAQITSWLLHFQSEVVSIASGSSSNTVSGHINPPPTDGQSIGLVIDGRTLMYALEEPLNEKFLDLAKRCQAVLCCRATPLQKVSCVSGSNNFFSCRHVGN